jgi:hypothetical protein
MPTKKKTSRARSKKRVGKKHLAKKRTGTKRTAKTRRTKQSSTPKKAAGKRAVARKKTVARKKIASVKSARMGRSRSQNEMSPFEEPVAIVTGLDDQTEVQSGDLQGLSEIASSDSESVRELLEEGNPFEAEVVQGVQNAGAKDRRVRSHEVSEDDVPEEYRDLD